MEVSLLRAIPGDRQLVTHTMRKRLLIVVDRNAETLLYSIKGQQSSILLGSDIHTVLCHHLLGLPTGWYHSIWEFIYHLHSTYRRMLGTSQS